MPNSIMTPEEAALDKKERNKNMDRYDKAMNPEGHYSVKGKKRWIASLEGKCLDGTPSKATKLESP